MGILSGEYEIKNIKNEIIITPDWCRKVCSSYPVKHRDIVKKVVISKNVKEITHAAFYSFTELKEISLPQGLKIIGDKSFCDCGNLEYIEIPDSVEYIGKEAFADCKKLRKIKLPAHLKEIKNSCFSGCVALESIEFPENITSIDNFAFNSCKSIQSFRLPERLEHIGEYAFGGCEGITEIVIPENVELIDKYAFFSCTNLKKFRLPKHFEIIPTGCFAQCNIENLIIDKNIKKICSSAFYGCKNLESVVFHKNLEYIDEFAFSKCPMISDVTIYDGTVTNIFAFYCDCFKFNIKKDKIVTLIGEKETITGQGEEFIKFAGLILDEKIRAISKMYNSEGKHMILRFFIFNYYDKLSQEGILFCMTLLIDFNDSELILELLENTPITSENIDTLLEYSIQAKKAELQVIFSNYKNKYFGFDSSDSFDKFLL